MISTNVSYIFDGLQFEELTDRTVGHYIFHIFITLTHITTHREKALREAGAKAEVRVATVAKRRLATEVFMVQIFE